MNVLRIGSRDSILAKAQSYMVMNAIEAVDSRLPLELVTMKTTGDRILDRTLDKVGGKGLFVKELDRALAMKEVDMTVHSLKDVPMEADPEMPLTAFSHREEARDVLVLPEGETQLDLSRPIGSSSMRRALQLKKLYPDAEVKSIRGNLQTRLAKLDKGEYGALVLAGAGLKRLGLADRISRFFETDEMIPAAGQGIIAVQTRAGENFPCLSGFHDENAALCAAAERSYVKRLDGGCSSPIAAYAKLQGDQMLLRALYYREETGAWCTGKAQGIVTTAEEAEMLGISLADRLCAEQS